tara:strand:+ start:489 stop:1454 length:966 start_codon:yes stop_codon:yes gene_type:complete
MKDYIGIHLSSFKDQFGIYETSISRLNDNGIPEIVPNKDGQNITPSVVEFIDKDSIVVGREAQDSIGINDENIVGLFNDDLSEDKTYKFFGKKYSQVSIIAMFLKVLKRDYEERKTNGEFNRVAIMVPTFYTRQDKRIIGKAAELAGYPNFSIIHENELAVLGGALYAKQTEKIGNRVEKMELTEAAPFYYGIIITEHETGKQFVRNLINKDEIIPIEVTETFHTIFENQTSIPISITQSSADLDDPEMVNILYQGNLVLSPGLPVKSAVDVTIGCKEDGSVACSYKDVQTGNVKNIDLRIGQSGVVPNWIDDDLDEFEVD